MLTVLTCFVATVLPVAAPYANCNCSAHQPQNLSLPNGSVPKQLQGQWPPLPTVGGCGRSVCGLFTGTIKLLHSTCLQADVCTERAAHKACMPACCSRNG